MLRGAACDFFAHRDPVTNVNWSFTKLMLEPQEARVRNPYRSFNICTVLILTSALSLLAQDGRELQGDTAQPLLTASVDASPAVGSASNDSGLPDAPSAAKPASAPDPTAAPAVKRESRGAPPAALGGPLSVDRSVADRNYLLVTGSMFGSSVADAELTIRCLQQHPSCNDVPSSLRSRVALYGIGIPADLGIAYLTYHMKKKHSRIWYVPATLVIGANAFLSVRAYRWMHD